MRLLRPGGRRRGRARPHRLLGLRQLRSGRGRDAGGALPHPDPDRDDPADATEAATRGRLLPAGVRRGAGADQRQEAGALLRHPHRGHVLRRVLRQAPRGRRRGGAPARVDRLPSPLRGVRRRHPGRPPSEHAARGVVHPDRRAGREGGATGSCARPSRCAATSTSPCSAARSRVSSDDPTDATTTGSAAPPNPAPPASSSASARPPQLEGAAHGRLPRRGLPRHGQGPLRRAAALPGRRPGRRQRPAQLQVVLPVADPAAVAGGSDVRRLLGAELTRRRGRSGVGRLLGLEHDRVVPPHRLEVTSQEVRTVGAATHTPSRNAAPRIHDMAASSGDVVTSIRSPRFGARQFPRADRRAQKPSLRSCLGSRCQSLAILTCRSR